MKRYSPTNTLIHGSNEISRKLRYFLSPTGNLYKFNTTNPRRPKPLSLSIVLSNCFVFVLPLLINYFLYSESSRAGQRSERLKLISQSKFLFSTSAFFETFRVLFHAITIVIVVVQHGVISNVMATSTIIVNKHEQTYFAKRAFLVFIIKASCNLVTFLFLIWAIHKDGGELHFLDSLGLLVVCPICVMLGNLALFAPNVYACYLGSSLGRHVENFSKLYIDTMFDQFVENANMDNESVCKMPVLKRSGDDTISLKSVSTVWLQTWDCCGFFGTVFRALKKIFTRVNRKLVGVTRHLNLREYPELPEMKMTKISLAVDVKITEAMRLANSQLFRVRLKKTQNMLSELRDLVSDINKLSSPLTLLLFISDTFAIVIITTASIQAKLFKSINLSILPTVSCTLSLTISVIYICICLDATTSQLQLMINKLFDFIIMSHRIQPELSGENKQSLSSWQIENEAISEIWSQFQYTRKLAGTIQFTIGGILQVSRRLVLFILGHILSAVFISIEIMSIVDTGALREKTTGLGGNAISIFYNGTSGP